MLEEMSLSCQSLRLSFAIRLVCSLRAGFSRAHRRCLRVSKMAAKEEKPSLPAEYKVPDVWESKESGGEWAGMNRPYAGARFEKELPKGEHPLQLYSMGTPNGMKVAIMLEELGVDYDAWMIDIRKLDQFGSGFTAINPNQKIPAMVDYSYDPPINVFESASILLYLADKYSKFIPADLMMRTQCINWLFWLQGVAPYIGGGFGHFCNYAPIHIEYAIDRYTMELKRILDVLDRHLEGKEYICGEQYTIADMVSYPWIYAIPTFYQKGVFVGFDAYKNVNHWLELVGGRDAVKRGMRVNGFGEDAVTERHSPDDFLVKSTA